MATAGVKYINVTWTKPADYKETYQYNLTWTNLNGSVNYIVSNNTAYNITDLVPGSWYNISVTTETSDGTQSALKSISVCTGMITVT